MAKNYAENLIGKWETNQYEPQRQVIQNTYNTNWESLTNQLNNLNDQLANNFKLMRQNYNEALGDINQGSFNRMYNAEQDLANRGLTGSGLLNNINQADTSLKGDSVNTELEKLMQTDKSNIEAQTKATTKYGSGLNDLAGDLAGDLGNVSNAETSNYQNYRDLVSSITQSAANRAASRAGSGSKKTKEESEAEELERRMLIADILASEDLSDSAKIMYMSVYADVPTEKGKAAISSMNYDKQKLVYDKAVEDYNKANDNYLKSMNKATSMPYIPGVLGTFTNPNSILSIPMSIANTRGFSANNKRKIMQDEQNKLNSYTYGDLYDILYGSK